MTHIYRETDPVSGRWTGNSGGIDLSAFQIDQNFYQIRSDIATLQANESFTVSIDFITQNIATGELTFHMTDHSLQGPFIIPESTFNSPGDGIWHPFTSYSFNDTFSINGAVYLVIFSHTSAATFDAGANDGLGHDYYKRMIALPGNVLPTGGAVGMMLTKSDGHDFDVFWKYPVPVGGSTGQVLAKSSNADFAMSWVGSATLGFISAPPPSPGGSAGQVPATVDGTHSNMEWIGVVYAPPPSPAGAAGQLLSTVDGTNTNTIWVDPAGGSGGVIAQNASLASPVGNVSTTEKAMGLGTGGSAFTYTCTGSGNVLIWIAGMVLNSTLAGDGVRITGRHGITSSISPPANGDTSGLGTQFSIPQHFIASTTDGQQGFMVMGKITDAFAGDVVWFDLSIVGITAGGATIKDVQFIAFETS